MMVEKNAVKKLMHIHKFCKAGDLYIFNCTLILFWDFGVLKLQLLDDQIAYVIKLCLQHYSKNLHLAS